MPLYEYECEQGHRFEKIQKFSDPLVSVCPTCGSVVHKLMSSPAIQFKGTGWYITDYAKKDSVASSESRGEGKTDSKNEKSEKSERNEKNEKSETKTETKAETKSDAAPAAKPDAKPSSS